MGTSLNKLINGIKGVKECEHIYENKKQAVIRDAREGGLKSRLKSVFISDNVSLDKDSVHLIKWRCSKCHTYVEKYKRGESNACTGFNDNSWHINKKTGDIKGRFDFPSRK